MSIADQFERSPDAGFIRRYDLEAARRQLQVSVLLIIVMACAAALAFLYAFDAPRPQANPTASHAGYMRVAQTLLDRK